MQQITRYLRLTTWWWQKAISAATGGFMKNKIVVAPHNKKRWGITKEEIAPLSEERVYWRGQGSHGLCWCRWVTLVLFVTSILFVYLGFQTGDIAFFAFAIVEVPFIFLNSLNVAFSEYVLTERRFIVYNRFLRTIRQVDLVSYLKDYRGFFPARQTWQPSRKYDLCVIDSLKNTANPTRPIAVEVFCYSISKEDIDKIKFAIAQIRAIHVAPQPNLSEVKYYPSWQGEELPPEQCPSWMRGAN